MKETIAFLAFVYGMSANAQIGELGLYIWGKDMYYATEHEMDSIETTMPGNVFPDSTIWYDRVEGLWYRAIGTQPLSGMDLWENLQLTDQQLMVFNLGRTIKDIELTPGPQGDPGTNATTTSPATTSTDGLMSSTDKTKLDAVKLTQTAIGTVSGGAGRYTFTYPTAYGSGVVPIVEVVAVKPTGSSVSYNASVYGDPTNTSCTVEVNTINGTITGILGLIGITSPAPNGSKVHIVVTAP